MERIAGCQQISRILKRPHVRRLIAKVPRTRRWHVTKAGRLVFGHIVRFFGNSHPQAV